MNKEREIKDHVRRHYSKIAGEEPNCCCHSCGCGTQPVEQAEAIGYTKEQLDSVASSVVMGLGCGNPTGLANLNKGEVVLDLGSGGGLDVFLASSIVGEEGKAIGVDMTPEMVELAERNAAGGGYQNVEFLLGEIEKLPVADRSVDVIISNCVINLAPDKSAVFREAHRVLKSGGRMLISDLVTRELLPEDIRRSFDAWSECVAGAMEKADYLETIQHAGFEKVSIISEQKFSEPGMDERLADKIVSVQVLAYKS